MIFGLSNDIFGLITTIAAIGIAVFVQIRSEMKSQTRELRSQTKNFTDTQMEMKTMNDFLKQSTLSHIDEKVAMLRGYALQTTDWKNIADGVRNMTDRIVADITSIVRIRNYMNDDQKIRINEALRHLTNSMSSNNYDIGRIEDVSKLLI